MESVRCSLSSTFSCYRASSAWAWRWNRTILTEVTADLLVCSCWHARSKLNPLVVLLSVVLNQLLTIVPSLAKLLGRQTVQWLMKHILQA